MLTMEIDAVYSRLYNVAMFTESKIKLKKINKSAPRRLLFSFLESARMEMLSMLRRRPLRKICFICFVRSATCRDAGEMSCAKNYANGASNGGRSHMKTMAANARTPLNGRNSARRSKSRASMGTIDAVKVNFENTLWENLQNAAT